MPNIGPAGSEVTCSLIIMPGPPGLFVQRVLSWTVPGFDGWGHLQTGKVPSPFSATCVRFALEAVVDAWILAMQALPGTVSVINDDWGKLQATLMIQGVSGQAVKVAALGAGYNTRGSIEVRGVRI